MPSDARPLHPATVAVTAGRGDPRPGAPLNVPVVLASTYRAGGDVLYGRDGNPTWSAFEAALGALEGGTAVAFASGLAAVAAVVATATPEEGVVVVPTDVYQGTAALLASLGDRVEVRAADVADTGAVLAACDGATLLWLESPTNPRLDVADLPAVVAGAGAAGVRVAVDNTFATPLFQRPLGLGADVVVHSATKFLGGHSDLLLGVAVSRDDTTVDALVTHRTVHGAVPGALDAFLALRGLRTLDVRLRRAADNAGVLARRLAAHAAVTSVRYPGLPDDPGHVRARAQMSGFGALVAFEVAGGAAAADRVCAAVRLIVHTTSLGGVETTMERRGTHPGQEHVPPGLVRLSVGIEDVEDLWADLEAALERIAA